MFWTCIDSATFCVPSFEPRAFAASLRAIICSAVPPGSCEHGVAQLENFTACSSVAACFLPSSVLPVASIFSIVVERPPLGVQGVGHAVNATILRELSVFPAALLPF